LYKRKVDGQMKVLLLSHSDMYGGAARAAARLHKALLDSEIQSRMRLSIKKSDLATVDGPQDLVGKALALLRPTLGGLLMRLQQSANPVFHSPALLPSGLVAELNRSDADVLNLHY
jgi:hypothetical protein